ncbi:MULTISPECIES: signal recognition particle protein [unclassified Pseudonocardia]|uniref:signal recognition particle protein n=1 Tax=unclassified Pseudonocardia TaxID=2619320 RepID=UPI00096870FF|nr:MULTISPECIES: signal recognition particle protein [unclassified Pseudonocardia]MBN9101874.1 signal recognition particle protein [Pseudonocardia sp.]OJY47240.1 MAG: signal recognition particle protein [Pseudonocardia sp. 73-21]
MFNDLSERLSDTLAGLRGKGRLSEADIDTTAREIRIALLEADVALPVVRAFVAKVKERAKGAEVSGALNPAQQVVKIVNEELVGILGGETRRIRLAKEPPTVIMLAGLQGAGKTTLAGKLAHWLKGQGHTPLLVACDLQRPNAVNQLQIVGDRAGVSTFAPHPGASATGQTAEPGNGTGDPVDVARRGVAHAREKHFDVVIVDTAGRLGVDEELMRQASDIRDATRPDETLFVVDAMIGQDAVATAEAFRDGVGFTGVVLTKLDGDARGGAALSVREVTGQPILFASTGEKLTEFDVFHPDRMASRILGMGDLLTLIEQAEGAFDQEQSAAAAQKMVSGELSLEDFLEQMMAIRKMGPIGNILGMLPGANSGQMKDALAQVDDRQLDKLQAIIRGMTPAERNDPKIINGSRRLRIANGSGVAVSDVNDLVTRFFEARKMMKQMAGQFGFGGGSRSATKKLAKSRKGKKGKGRPTPSRALPAGMGMPDLSGLPPSLQQLPPGLDQLPPGFDPSKLKFPKGK